MDEDICEVRLALVELAERAIQSYARGLLTTDWLLERLTQAWRERAAGKEVITCSLDVLARSLCAQVLYAACQSSDARVRDLAFENLRGYLAAVLARECGAELRAEVLQQTMIEIFQCICEKKSGPENPAAFLKWARVILLRQLSHHKRQSWHVDLLSLEAQNEPVLAGLVDETGPDPLERLLQDELRAQLKRAIATLRNVRYQTVLLKTFFDGWNEQELAALWQVRVKDIYLWRFRALQALRKLPDVVDI
jgi:RNA polymerase sigma factor (sigma-70 family)